MTLVGIAIASEACAEPLIFEKDVYPIFQKRCAGCHFPDAEQLKAKLDLSTGATALAGGKSGPSIVPGSSATSPMIISLLGKRDPVMPPPEKFEELPADEIAVIAQWIDEGARFDASIASAAATAEPEAGAQPASPERPAAITSSAWTSDAKTGQLLYAHGSLRMVELVAIDPQSGKGETVATLEGHGDMVRALAFSPDGAYLAAAGGPASRAGEIVLWRVADRARVWTQAAHKDAVLDVAFSPDGMQVATSSYDKTIMLWNTGTGEPIRTLRNHVDAVFAMAFSPDGALLASGGGDRMVKIWDTKTGALITTISDAKDAVMTLAFAPNGTRLAAGGADKIIRVWEMGAARFDQTAVSMGTLLRSSFAHDGAVLRLRYSPDSATLYSTGEDRAIKAWDAETLTEMRSFEKQSDWVSALALSPDGRLLSAGRFDASESIYAAETGAALSGENPAVMAIAEEPGRKKVRSLAVEAVIIEATVPPSIGGLSPSRLHRGGEFEILIDGKNLEGAQPVVTHPGIVATLIANEAQPPPEISLAAVRGTGADVFDNARPYRVKIAFSVPQDAATGYYELMFRTGIGLTNAQGFTVDARPDLGEAEPNDTAEQAQAIVWPAVVSGQIGEPGDVDRFRLTLAASQEIVFAITDSAINPALRLFDSGGASVAEAPARRGADAGRLGYRAAADGDYTLEVGDADLRGGLGYRLHAGAFPYVTRAWPLGVRAGAPAKVEVDGFNLGTPPGAIEVSPPATASHDTTMPLPIVMVEGSPIAIPSIAVAAYDEALEAEPNNTVAQAQPISFPFTVNARIESAQDIDLYRFPAAKGQRVLIETTAARLGSPIDTIVEIVGADGEVLRRGVVRCVAETFVTLSNRDSMTSGIRLDSWRDLAIGDLMMIGSEIIQVDALPDYGDEDVSFKAYPSGQRHGVFGTTPEYHSVNQKAFKIEVLPPDAQPAPNGMPVFPLLWTNDDGFFGEGTAQGDSLLEFTAPADGEHVVRVRDAIAEGGERYAYRLMLRPAEPDFDVVMAPYRVNISRGSRRPVEVRVRRKDGFSGPVTVRLHGLPEGYSAEPDVIPGDDDHVRLALVAGPEAQSTPMDATFRISAEAELDGQAVVRETYLGPITVSEVPADLTVHNGEMRVAIAPGQSGWISVRLGRANGFKSRVPIEVLNLPVGVRVMDTGLNGILVREGEFDRKMELFVEPWVPAMTRNIYVQASIETVSSAQPVFIGEAIELSIASQPGKMAAKP